MEVERTFPLRYRVERGAFHADDLRLMGSGHCDAIVLVGIIRGSTEERGFTVAALDGRGEGQLHALDMFQVWNVLAQSLMETDLPDGLVRVAERSLAQTKVVLQTQAARRKYGDRP